MIENRMGRNGRGASAVVALLLVAASALPAHALSEIKREQLPPVSTAEPEQENPFPGNSVPLPGPIQSPAAQDGEPAGPEEADPEITGPEDGVNQPDGEADADAAVPEVMRDLALLPEPARRMHGLIVEACRTGQIENLRPLIGGGENGTQLSFGGTPSDPISHLKELSGDDQGQEILAILLEVLEAGYVHLDAGSESELYVWPYFFAVPLERLTAPQRVELFTIVTAGDYADMEAYGAYIFYRVGITPEGRWAFFVAGD
jgi:hypothetical protein